MARGAVGARVSGDLYQGMFFWYMAANLLISHSKTKRVILEHDEAAGADDVAVFHDEPGISFGRQLSTADFYQVKYHVDQRDVYSSESLMARPTGGGSSLLERLNRAYRNLSEKHSSFRIFLLSNRPWANEDPLRSIVREPDSCLSETFFTHSPGSQLGQIRTKWQEHLDLPDKDFSAFCRALRLDVSYLSRNHLRTALSDRLALAGLTPLDETLAANPYDSLVQQFLVTGLADFDRTSFRELCQRERLWLPAKQVLRPETTVAIRSFMRSAEQLEGEADEFVCVAEQFDGRHPRQPRGWQEVATTICRYLGKADRRARLRRQESQILLECHGSLALLAGYELSRNSGCEIYPIQKPGRRIWKPSLNCPTDVGWVRNDQDIDTGSKDVAIALSLTHHITPDVLSFLKVHNGLSVRTLVSLQPQGGTGSNCIRDADHAAGLASELVALWRPLVSLGVRAHLFFSAPNSFLFFLGQYREALGAFTCYEFDFSQAKSGSYSASIAFPIPG